MKEQFKKFPYDRAFVKTKLFKNKHYMNCLIKRIDTQFHNLDVDIIICANSKYDLLYAGILASYFRCGFKVIENKNDLNKTKVFLCGIRKEGIRKRILNEIAITNSNIVGESYILSNNANDYNCIIPY